MRLLSTSLLLFLITSPVHAHAIRASVSVTETQVVVTVSFDGDDDLRGDVYVWLEDEQNNKLTKVKLSGTNTATFPRPAEGVYFVVAEDDGFGHRVKKKFLVQSGQTEQAPPPDQSVNTIKIIQGVVGILFSTAIAYFFFFRKSGKAKHGS